MNDNAKKWVEALRSGQYSQVRSYLHTEKGYCCLGIACELYQEEIGDLTIEMDKAGLTRYNSHDSVLPQKVRKWLGLKGTTGGYTKYDDHLLHDYHSLSGANDQGASFEDIADIIESQPKGLFE